MFKNKLFYIGLFLTVVGLICLVIAFSNIIDPFYYAAAACFYLGAAILIYSFFSK